MNRRPFTIKFYFDYVSRAIAMILDSVVLGKASRRVPSGDEQALCQLCAQMQTVMTEAADRGSKHIFFVVPVLMFGVPAYDQAWVRDRLVAKARQAGYLVTEMPNHVLRVAWDHAVRAAGDIVVRRE